MIINTLVISALLIASFGCIEKNSHFQNSFLSNDKNLWNSMRILLKKKKLKIIFSENFEATSVKKIVAKWDDTKNTKGMSLNNDTPLASKGKQSLMMTYNPGINNGGHLFKSFPKGYNKLYARFYIKFLTRKTNIHHFVKLGGYSPPTKYPQGNAGKQPKGNDWFISGIEPKEDFAWGFYTYWMQMFGTSNGYWGNNFLPKPAKKIPLGEWICVEFMLNMNNPKEVSNGEQAFWINGEKILHLGKGFPKLSKKGDSYMESPEGNDFRGFQWRNDTDLKISFFWLSYYMTKGSKGQIEKVLFDDVIVSTGYIGQL